MENITGLNYYNQVFETEDKVKAFDKLAEMFYDRNFGTAGKAEVELWLFKTFMDNLIKNNVDKNNVLDYNKTSDYTIGKMLGIPQERVRNLKIKSQARYPVAFSWQESLKTMRDSIVYDENKDKIIIPVRDPNLYNEIRNFIEEKGGYIEIQRGSNCIQIRPQYFFILLYLAIEDEDKKKDTRKAFAKKLKERNNDYEMKEIKTDDELAEAALQTGGDFLEFVDELLTDAAEAVSHPLLFTIKGIRRIAKVIGKK